MKDTEVKRLLYQDSEAFKAGIVGKTEIIEKACKWLDENATKYESGTGMGCIPFSNIEDMINDFRKAMLEEE